MAIKQAPSAANIYGSEDVVNRYNYTKNRLIYIPYSETKLAEYLNTGQLMPTYMFIYSLTERMRTK